MGRLVISLWTVLLCADCMHCRSWRDIQILPVTSMDAMDLDAKLYLDIIQLKLRNATLHGISTVDPTYFDNRTISSLGPSPSPSNEPTFVPSTFPSSTPTLQPSDMPTDAPSSLPSSSPSHLPSFEPSNSPSHSPSFEPSTSPSTGPSSVPTLDPYPLANVPKEGDRGYFNYEQSIDSEYGPEKWGDVELPKDFYWDEFGKNGYGPWNGALNRRKYRDNVCDRGLKHQSPIDVVETVSSCNETHEIRDHNGDHALNDTSVEKRIESNKLRLVFPRRPCPDVLDIKCQFPHPPWADFPNGFPGISDVIHIDFKIPSEHWLRGQSFDGEIQIYHVHVNSSRIIAISTLIQATEQGHNHHLQLALDTFQEEYNKNQATCAESRSVGSGGIILPPITPIPMDNSTLWNTTGNASNMNTATGNSNFTTSSNMTTSATSSNTSVIDAAHNRRILHNIPEAWDPYHPDIFPSIYFYRYDGSITEPPCSEIVTWFVTDIPITISIPQLQQWKNIQFTNVDPKTCQSTSVQYRQSVARPIKYPIPTDRVVSRCTADHFGPDIK